MHDTRSRLSERCGLVVVEVWALRGSDGSTPRGRAGRMPARRMRWCDGGAGRGELPLRRRPAVPLPTAVLSFLFFSPLDGGASVPPHSSPSSTYVDGNQPTCAGVRIGVNMKYKVFFRVELN